VCRCEDPCVGSTEEKEGIGSVPIEEPACVANKKKRTDRRVSPYKEEERIGVCCRTKEEKKTIRVSDQEEERSVCWIDSKLTKGCVSTGREEESVCRIELDRVSIGVCHQV